MILLILSIPLSLLCFYLAFLAWRRRYRRHAAVLAFFGFFFLAAGVVSGVITALSYQSLRF